MMRILLTLTLTLLLVVSACDDGHGGGACVAPLADDCGPLYTPTWDEVYDRTIAPKCAQGGSACHGAAPGQDGLLLDSKDAAYTALVDGGLTAGALGCATVVRRIGSVDAGFVKPPGAPLSEAERCSVERWIAAGTPR